MNKNTLKPSQGKETEANSGNPLPAVFIDRDGTLMEEVHYCNDPSQVAVFSGAADALQALRRAGYRTIMVTNQSGIAKGLITQEQYEAVHAQFLECLGSSLLDATYMCADASGSPGMLLEAAEDWNLDLGRSWIIGDKTIDIECGAAVGVPGVLVLTGHGRGQDASGAVYIAENFAEAVRWILR
jgi:D-glycero-D-manno-heptose 1,7-bisphosphate phosphatase